ncbi:hypothetical protein [Brachybacterium sp. FME24]|uniref:hypothetical protein n=1 Tax=Brachybacterium sp. FME24 TaxID=2742605 RepID=UPI001869490C|nr:hypothetical protein [Brachybacterium sp. FME24]
MADWKTYAKAARNTARKQAPGARDAAKRATSRAGDYARAAGRAVDEGRSGDDASRGDDRSSPDGARPPRTDSPTAGTRAPRPDARREGAGRSDTPRTATQQRPAVDTDKLRKDAVAYYTVAERRMRSAQIVPRVLRALRDALLIGLSLFVIWLVLAAAGLQIPFTTVLIVVLVIVALSFAGGVYSRFRQRGRGAEDGETPDD